MDSIFGFFKGIGNGIVDFFSGIFDFATDVGDVVLGGINNLINFLTNSFTTLYELVEIFPIECRVSLLAFLGVASAYLAYKIIKGG